MIIDCHCHAGPGDGFTGPWDTARRPGPLPAAGAPRPASTRTVLFAAFHSDYAARQPRGGARSWPRRPGPLLGLRVRPRRARPRPRATRWCGRRSEELRLPRHQGPSARRPHHARGLRGGARLRAARALRRDGRGDDGRAAGAGVPRRGLHHPAPRRASPTTGAAQLAFIDHLVRHPERLHRHLRRAPLRSAGRGRAARRRAARSSSAATAPGCTRPWSWPRSAPSGLPPGGRAAGRSAATSCA